MKKRVQIKPDKKAIMLDVYVDVRLVRNKEVPEMQPFLLSLWICPLALLAVQALPNSISTNNKYKKILSSLQRKKIMATHTVISSKKNLY